MYALTIISGVGIETECGRSHELKHLCYIPSGSRTELGQRVLDRRPVPVPHALGDGSLHPGVGGHTIAIISPSRRRHCPHLGKVSTLQQRNSSAGSS
jgi:hypothetical protein